jgi:hypothetical protein
MSGKNDFYLWIGMSGAAWSDPSNWKDQTSGAKPALSAPGPTNPVTINGPTVATFETIDGGGASANLSITGSVDLSGDYTTGALSVDGSGTGGAAALALDPGAILTVDGTISMLDSALTLDSGATLISTAGATIYNASLVENGPGATATVSGQLTLAGSDIFLYRNNDSVEVAGSILVVNEAQFIVDFSDSTFKSTGTVFIENAAGATNIAALSGLIQVAGISIENSAPVLFNGNQYNLTITANPGAVEIGTLGAAASDQVTVDAGATIESTNANVLLAYTVANSGVISDTDGVLTLIGQVTNTGLISATNGGLTFPYTSVSFDYTLINDGTIDLSGGILSLTDLSGDGMIDIGGQGTLVVGGPLGSGNTINFAGTGATLQILDSTGNQPPSAANPIASVISGLADGDAIVFASDTSITSADYAQTGPGIGTLTVSAGTRLVDSLTLAGDYTQQNFALALDPTHPLPGHYDVVDIVCFFGGTRIATPAGEREVETLTAGDLVLTVEGDVCPIRWVGRNTVSTRFQDPLRCLPIRIRAGALGAGLPRRDLLVSPEHAMFLDGFLIQAGAMVNGVTVVRETDVPEVFTYYHIELDTHRLILAEGAASESFIDNVERTAFDNWDEHPAMDPDEMIELPYARAKSARQLPKCVARLLADRAAALNGKAAMAA